MDITICKKLKGVEIDEMCANKMENKPSNLRGCGPFENKDSGRTRAIL